MTQFHLCSKIRYFAAPIINTSWLLTCCLTQSATCPLTFDGSANKQSEVREFLWRNNPLISATLTLMGGEQQSTRQCYSDPQPPVSPGLQ